MTELQFDLGLYSSAAIDLSVKAFEPFANIERRKSDGAEIICLTANEDEDESLLAGELANYVLGATVDLVESSVEPNVEPSVEPNVEPSVEPNVEPSTTGEG